MEYSFTGICKVTMQHNGSGPSKLLHTDMRLEVSKNLDKAAYLTPDDLPKGKAGYQFATIAFMNGVAASIHAAHNEGVWDSAEHYRFVLAELEKLFITVAHSFKSEM